MALRVGIVGAGIGGLTLAHALRRRGIDVVVADRDTGPGDTAGYRLHLTAPAFTALAEALPASSVRALRDCGAGNAAFTRFAVLDHRGHTRLRLPVTHPGEVLMIGRRPLRRILARDLPVRWNTTVRAFDATATGVRLDDGTEVDVLVAADGTGSRIARQWAGRRTDAPAGVTGIAGRADLPQRIPGDLRHGLAFAVGPRGVGAFFSLQAHQGRDPAAERPHIVWSVATTTAVTGTDLVAEVHRLTSGWTPDFHRLVEGSDPAGVAAFAFAFPAALRPWPAGRVTLLGDAIHPMPPTAGAGASTAILDAAHLADDLATRAPAEALATYRARLLRYAPAAVDEARPALTWQRRLAHPAVFAAATGIGFPLAAAALRLSGAFTAGRAALRSGR